MNWYKKASKEDAIIWKCPKTGLLIVAPRMDGEIMEYSLYAEDGSYVDSYPTWYMANKVAKEIDRRVDIPKSGILKK